MCSHSHVTFYEQFDCFHYADFSLVRRKLERLWWAHAQPARMKPTGQPWNWAVAFNKTMWQLSESLLNTELNELHNLINSKVTSCIDKSVWLTDSLSPSFTQTLRQPFSTCHQSLLGFLFVCFWSGVGCQVAHSPCWPWTSYVTKDGLELMILLPLPPKCWDNRYVLSWLVYAMLDVEPRLPKH